MLYHNGLLSQYPMDCGHDRALDPFSIFNHILAQKSKQSDQAHLWIRTSTHKLTAEELVAEQQRHDDPRKDMIGIACILEILPPLQRYVAVALNGLYSRELAQHEQQHSLRLLSIAPLTEYADFA